jgi:hypothetical protein
LANVTYDLSFTTQSVTEPGVRPARAEDPIAQHPTAISTASAETQAGRSRTHNLQQPTEKDGFMLKWEPKKRNQPLTVPKLLA